MPLGPLGQRPSQPPDNTRELAVSVPLRPHDASWRAARRTLRGASTVLVCGALLGPTLGCDRTWSTVLSKSPDESAQPAPDRWQWQPTVHAQGSLLPAQGVLRLTSTPGNRIEEVLVKPAEQVKAGEQLVRLASDRAREEELRLLDERIAEARQLWELEVAEADESVAQAERAVQQAELNRRHAAEQVEFVRQAGQTVELARRPLQRLEQAAQDPATRTLISGVELDRQRLAVEQADQQWRQSQLAATQAQEAAEIAVEAAQRQLAAAQQIRARLEPAKSLDVLRQQRVVLETQQEIARIVAPVDGTILRVEANPGDSVGQLPLVEMADLSTVHCLAEVHEADAPRVSIGQTARMQSAALAVPLTGRVVQIDSLVGRPQLRSPNPLAPVDFRAVGVTIELDRESAVRAARWIQLQVEVTIDTPQQEEQPREAATATISETANPLSGSPTSAPAAGARPQGTRS